MVARAEELELELELTESRDQALLREGFTTELIEKLKPKQNCIETRAITNAQIDTVVKLIQAKGDDRIPKHYYYRKKYYVVTDGEQPMLAAIKEEGSKEKNDDIHRLIVSLEGMWSALWKVHKSVNFNGRTAMEHEANKFYHNNPAYN